MLKKLKQKMLLTIMLCVTAIFLTLLLVIVYIPYKQSREEAKNYMQQALNKSTPPDHIPEEPPVDSSENAGSTAPELPAGSTAPNSSDSGTAPELPAGSSGPSKDNPKLFAFASLVTADFSADGTLIHWSGNRDDLYDEAYLTDTYQELSKSDRTFGTYEDMYYLLRHDDTGTQLVLLENHAAFASFRKTLILTIIWGVLAWGLFLLLSIWLVNRMTKPITEALNRQRQFISDAGHELKTPVAVISANADVLSGEIGDSKWLSYIQTETGRMEQLIASLMELAEIDDMTHSVSHTRLNLSQVVMGAALPFESLTYEKGLSLDLDVAPNLFISGCSAQMEQLVTILLSNAVKYADSPGQIRLSLSAERSSILLTVYNSGTGVKPEELSLIFERFYRVDKDRSRKSGSYGLGLAIAAAIAREHHARIHAESEYGTFFQITVRFPAH